MRSLLLLGVGALGLMAYKNMARRDERHPDRLVARRGDAPNAPAQVESFRITSPAFAPGSPIPAVYSGEADDKSPPLRISGVPEGTQSMVLIMEDLDSPLPPVFTHWLVWNIPPETAEIPEGRIPKGAVQGKNTLKNMRYNGPCTPNGTHYYHFKLFALDTKLDLPRGATKSQLKMAMRGHVLAECVMIGTYTANRTTRGNLMVNMLRAASKV